LLFSFLFHLECLAKLIMLVGVRSWLGTILWIFWLPRVKGSKGAKIQFHNPLIPSQILWPLRPWSSLKQSSPNGQWNGVFSFSILARIKHLRSILSVFITWKWNFTLIKNYNCSPMKQWHNVSSTSPFSQKKLF